MRASFLVPAIALIATPAVAQSTQAETYVQQASEAIGAPLSDVIGPTESVEAMAASLLSLPPGTNAVVFNQTGTDNAITVEQTGLDNRVVVSQIGSGNRTGLVQDGSRNLFAATIFGDDNLVTANQMGDDNAYVLVMVGTNPEHVVSQLGDGNTATQVVAPGLQPAGIEQRGNGLDVLVERF
ncbi:MAG TPA: hypothetical protein VF594_09840 [Rubricoccaceae bacterium]